MKLNVMQDPADNVKPIKPERMKQTNRIDGIVAADMALGRAMQEKDEQIITKGFMEI